MNRSIAMLAMSAMLAACATTGLNESERLALYRAHAGPPIKDFSYFNNLNGWSPLGDKALTVWTRPGEAYLLELSGPCQDLDFAPAISITNMMGRVSARFDKVIVHGRSTPHHFPCRIREIRPLNVKALKQAERELREVDAIERDRAEGA